MELSELTAYAREKYGVEEQHKWADFPGFSVLCHPQTGKWVALLMRQWDGDTGTEIERCDLKCGRQSLVGLERPWLSPPLRMRGSQWTGVAFGEETEAALVFRLFDRAVSAGVQHGCTIVLDSAPPAGSGWQDTPLPFGGDGYPPPKDSIPEKLRQMRRLVSYGGEPMAARARNFYSQAKFMEDYEDEAPWPGDFVCYFPTYRDLNTRQLRGYFSWRARVRRGEFQEIPASAAYLYIYELLNGVGADSPEDSLRKLKAFEVGYLDSGLGDQGMRRNLRRWMLELAVVKGLPPETARSYADPELIGRDQALAVLQSPEEHADEEVFGALCLFAGKKLMQSPVLALDADRGKRLFCDVWRRAASAYRCREKDLFTLCFGARVTRSWYPLANAVYDWRDRPQNRDYTLDESRSYRCRNGIWQSDAYDKLSFDRDRLQGLLHEADRRLRSYLKTGRPLRENPADAWAAPFIDAVIEADRRAVLEAARPKIKLDLSGLDQIREDALITRDSLLTEEELFEAEEPEVSPPEEAEAPTAEDSILTDYLSEIPLDAVQLQILHTLLRGDPADSILKTHHLMPSLVADALNEALYDEIGDVVIQCEGDSLSLTEDYREELARILEGA